MAHYFFDKDVRMDWESMYCNMQPRVVSNNHAENWFFMDVNLMSCYYWSYADTLSSNKTFYVHHVAADFLM